jgi:mannose-6-phosphate isomerase-like protein (cupin superfamily)
MSEVVEVESLQWELVRPEITHGVFGKTLLAHGVKTVLTRVAPGGKFAQHKDHYGHLFYFLSGQGVMQIAEKQFAAQAGLVVRIAPGEPHAYENTGTEDLVLLSLNLPAA